MAGTTHRISGAVPKIMLWRRIEFPCGSQTAAGRKIGPGYFAAGLLGPPNPCSKSSSHDTRGLSGMPSNSESRFPPGHNPLGELFEVNHQTAEKDDKRNKTDFVGFSTNLGPESHGPNQGQQPRLCNRQRDASHGRRGNKQNYLYTAQASM